MRISTKKGDKGESSLLTGKKLSKGGIVFDVLGDLDEMSCFTGWVKNGVREDGRDGGEVVEFLERVQDDLYRMMSVVGNEMAAPEGIVALGSEDVEYLEGLVEKYEAELGKLDKFLKLDSNEAAARLNILRGLCRWCERDVVRAKDELGIPAEMLEYMNRLSDLLFLMAVKFDRMSAL
jgi:cob(I)alamin adenosyltransferase